MDYYKSQLDKVKGENIKIKITSDNGGTNWIDINKQSITAIEIFLHKIK